MAEDLQYRPHNIDILYIYNIEYMVLLEVRKARLLATTFRIQQKSPPLVFGAKSQRHESDLACFYMVLCRSAEGGNHPGKMKIKA